MSSPLLPSPDRRTPAGPGPLAGHEPQRIEPAPDMERALGALRDFTRRDILLRFYSDHKPRSVDDVAKAASIHRSVAFDHLERLVALGYLEVERRRGLPGKPAKIYRLTAGPLQISHPMRRYDVLAEALAGSIADSSSDGGRAAMTLAGRTFGQTLARPGARNMLAALEPLIEMGGEYALEDRHLSCTNCLFAEVCRRNPVICHFHAGAIEGLSTRGVRSLGFEGRGGCAYEVSER